MRILLVAENESALKKNHKVLFNEHPEAELIGSIPSIQSSVNWLMKHPMPDLIIMDMACTDGLSLRAFHKIKITCPVIFTTEQHHYMLQPFLVPKNNVSISSASAGTILNKALSEQKTIPTNPAADKRFKSRFVIRLGDTIKSIPVSDIAYFYTENKSNFICTNIGKRLPVDHTMDEIEQIMDPRQYFRLNRQFIIGFHAIEEMKAHTRSRVIVKLSPSTKLDTRVSVDRAHEFKKWIAE